MLKIFLSSTYGDLLSERQSVQAALQLMSSKYISMNVSNSFAEQSLEKSLSKVRSSDIFILILGYSYGFIPEGSATSMTEAEYQEAKANNISVLAYLADYKPYSPEACDDIRLWNLKGELKFAPGVSFYKTSEDLAWKVVSDLAREFADFIAVDAPPMEKLCNQIMLNSVGNRIDELISVLDERVEKIYQELAPLLDSSRDREKFNMFLSLHERHVNNLYEKEVIKAHETLVEIHHLLANDSRASGFPEFTRLNFVLGAYLAGGTPEAVSYKPGQEWWISGHSKLSPSSSVKIYKNILSEASNSIHRTFG